MKDFKKYCSSILFILFCSMPVMATMTASEVLKKSDQTIIPQQAKFKIHIETSGQNEARKQVLIGLKKGKDKNLLIMVEPSSVKDITHLRKRNSIWTFYPTISKTIRKAYKALFMNTTLSYGDIISRELTNDYTAEFIDQQSSSHFTLKLSPKKNTEGYAKILCKIDRKSYLPIKRDYYSLSNILIKECEFKNIKVKNGKIISLEQHFKEPLKNTTTIVRYFDIEHDKKIPDSFYSANRLHFLNIK